MILLRRPAFFRDLDHCAAHIARDNPDAARRLIDAAEITCELVRSQPEIGHQESFRRQRGIRSWRFAGFKNYLVFYRVNPDSQNHGVGRIMGVAESWGWLASLTLSRTLSAPPDPEAQSWGCRNHSLAQISVPKKTGTSLER